MDINNLKGLMEAYQQVNAPIDEAVKGESSERRRGLAAERRSGIKPLSSKEGEKYASHKISQMAYTKRAKMGEELDIFDVVLEFLQAEGFAETLEEAEWMMANQLNKEDIANILEVLDTPEKAQEYAKKNVKSMLGAFAKGVLNKDISQLKTIEKRKRGAELGKRKAERKAAEEN